MLIARWRRIYTKQEFMKTLWTLLGLLMATALMQAQHIGRHHYRPVPMTEQEFRQALRQVQQESFDSGKMRIAKGVINGHYLWSGQVRLLLKEFSFKSNQEDLAMYAYPKTIDQNKFYVIYDVFTFNSSKDKISEWVNSQPMHDYQTNPYLGPIPMTEQEFAQALHHLRQESFDDGKMNVAKQMVKGHYLYAHQVKKLVKEFNFKGGQEEIAKYAYPKTFDQKNYYIVFDAFSFSSSKRALDEWLEGQPVNDYSRPVYPPINTNPNLGRGQGQNWGDAPNSVGPNYNTPNHTISGNIDHGNHNVQTNPINTTPVQVNKVALSEAEFQNVKRQLNGLTTDQDKLARAKQISDQTYWKAGQVRELVDLFIFEDMRLDFAQYAYAKTLDQGNYYLVKGGLTDPQKKQDLINYIQQQGGTITDPATTTNTTAIQPISIRDFAAVKAEITAFSSDSDRLSKAKDVVANHFFTAAQVKELMELFIFEDVRLDFAKYAYQKTFDPQNYAVVKAVLVNESSKRDLQQYINQY